MFLGRGLYAGLIGGNRLHLGRRRRSVLVVVGAGDLILLIENLVAEEVGLASELKGPFCSRTDISR
jgi:hypothetical protein